MLILPSNLRNYILTIKEKIEILVQNEEQLNTAYLTLKQYIFKLKKPINKEDLINQIQKEMKQTKEEELFSFFLFIPDNLYFENINTENCWTPNIRANAAKVMFRFNHPRRTEFLDNLKQYVYYLYSVKKKYKMINKNFSRGLWSFFFFVVPEHDTYLIEERTKFNERMKIAILFSENFPQGILQNISSFLTN